MDQTLSVRGRWKMDLRWTIGVLVCVCVNLPLRADESAPDWLPPLPPRPPFWEMTRPADGTPEVEDFTKMLLNRAAATADASAPFSGGRLQLSQEATFFHSLSWASSVDSPDTRALRELPALPHDWSNEHSLKMPLPVRESIFMFGQYNTSGDIDQTQNRVSSRTGVGWKWSPFSGGEVQVRTSSLVTYTDDIINKTSEKSQISVQLQAKMALAGPVQVRYAGEALPAVAQNDRNQLLQDLKVALPFGDNRELSLGAKYRWDDTLTPTPWIQRAELYLGFKFQH